ncbi:helix-turn-helix domain-containing protein [Shewanella holmiensis]|uniref:Helix-turn-helix domain-containing protein n=1 Tax=Shewanella holmiensis TaxID=2952222 RepID=A0A9X3AV96_9GAMM|nr:helix-turn-helix domain-containing protein [Shewanella holmiensis]MCT7942410.1 helix-turn-helix domain-containing protein [Shewanella holmiensis]
MSMELMVKAMKAKVGNPLRKLVLLKLADNANDQGECWPSYNYIAEQCEMSRRSVMDHVKKLETSGFLRREYRKGIKGNSSNVFHLNFDENTGLGGESAALPSESVALPPSESVALPPSESPALPSESAALPLVNLLHPEPVTLEPVNESLKDLVTTSKNSALDFSKWPALPSEQVFKDWLAVRKQKRAKLTQTAVDRLAPDLISAAGVGLSVDDVLGLCVERCWIAFKFDWLVNAGLVAKQAVRADWSYAVFDPEDPLI